MKHGRKQSLEEQAQTYLQEQKVRGEQMFSRWSSVPEIGFGLDAIYAKNPHKGRLVATALQNEENHLKQLNETIISQNFSTTPENVLKIVRIGTANSHRADFATEIPLSTTDDAIFFIDMTYENTEAGRDATAGDKIYEKAYPYYAGQSAYIDTVGNAGTTYTITPQNRPIMANKVFIMLDNALIGYDDGDGAITLVGTTLVSGTVTGSYGATATVTLVFTAAVAASSTIRVVYEWDSEDSDLYDEYGKVSLTVSKKRFNATLQPLGYTYSTMTEILLGTTGLGNAEDLLLGAVGDEHAKAKDYRAIAMLKAIAKSNSDTYTYDADFAVAGEVSSKSHAQNILGAIDDIGGDIYDDIKRGMVNKAIVGSRAITYLRKHDLWKNDDSSKKVGVYHGGSLAGIDVYVCPADNSMVANNEMLLTYKNPEEGLDVGIAFGVLTEVTASLAYPQFYIDGNVGTVEDKMIITRDFVKIMTIDNLPVYVN